MHYGITTLTHKIGAVSTLLDRLDRSLKDGAMSGQLAGCWYSEIGALNNVLLMHAYADAGALFDDRARVLHSNDPFASSELLTEIGFEGYHAFPDLPTLEPGKPGPFYEVRRYSLTLGGLRPTIDAWAKVRQSRSALSPLMVVMYAVDGGVPRFMHIWPYQTLDQRLEIRAKAVQLGVWPPPGGPQYLRTMRSEIFLPAAFSPAQ